MRTRISVALVTLIVCAAAAAQQAAPPAGAQAARPNPDPQARARTQTIDAGDTSADAMAVLQLERDVESHTVAGDVAWVSAHLADNFVMIHGDSWTFGKPLQLADNKDSYLLKVKNKNYLARYIAQSKVEMHGDIAITWGEYVSENAPGGTARSWFSIWYERIFEKRNGQWVFVSHRTVNGPNYGPDAATVTPLIDQNRTNLLTRPAQGPPATPNR